MKHIKLLFLSVILVMFTLSSCTNNEAIVQSQETASSPSARKSMQALQSHFDDNGQLKTGKTGNNHTGSIYFDFGFDFVYPVTLSYNTGATVTVNNFDVLIEVLVSMTDNLYIDGIQFPFDVSYYDYDTDSMTTITINNEDEFEAFLASLNFYDDPCNLDDTDDNDVCIEIQDPSGNYVVTFPNISYAECEGFTQDDVVDCGDYHDWDFDFSYDCFDLVFPISLSDDGTTYVLNSETEFSNFSYTCTSDFDFVYPFNITLVADGSIVTINNANDLDFLFLDCDLSFSDDCWEFDFPITINGVTYEENDFFNFDIDDFNFNTDVLDYPFDVEINGNAHTINTSNDFHRIGEFEHMCE